MRSTSDPLPSATSGSGTDGRTIAVAQFLRLIIRLGSAAALARLLTPQAYGVFGMAAVVFGLLTMARDFGIVTALQQPDATPQRFNALCRVGLLGGCALALLGALLAWPTGRFFQETDTVPWALAAMSFSFPFAGLAAPAIGLLYREGRGGRVALLEAAAIALGSGVAVFAAWRGAGVWSLVAMGVVADAAACAFAWLACSRRPASDTTGTSWRALAELGAQLTGHNLAAYLMRTLDQVMVGRVSGTSSLGLYGRGAQLAALPVQFGIAPFHPWILATLASRTKAPAAYTAFFRAALNSLLHVSLMGATLCVAVPDRLILVLFGETWLPASPIVRWLGVALAVQPWLAAPAWLLSAPHAVRRLLAWSVSGVIFMLIGCAFVYRLGPAAIAGAAAGAAVAQAALAPVFCAGMTAARLADWLAASLLPLGVHGGCGLLLATVNLHWPAASGSLAYFSVPAALGAGYYALMILLCPPLRRELRQLVFWSR